MTGKFDMSDYVPVNERVEAFYKAYPEGSIQSEIVELTGSRVTVKAYAYRKPDDVRPGMGHSSLEIPGSTPYTRGSEIENAETSAWGRAIAALGFEVKRGIASSEEVRNKTPQREGHSSAAASRPVAGGAKAASPQPSPAPDDDVPEFPPPLDDEPPVPYELQERIQRAASKGQPAAEHVCPEHRADRVKRNKRGYYCATKVGDGWCDWSAAA